jgi:hypothetical protein
MDFDIEPSDGLIVGDLASFTFSKNEDTDEPGTICQRLKRSFKPGSVNSSILVLI